MTKHLIGTGASFAINGFVGSALLLKDLSSVEVPPTQYAIFFDPTKEQVDAMLAKHEYLIIFTFVTVPAAKAPDMTWIEGYTHVVSPLWLGNIKESKREGVAQHFVRNSLNATNLVQVTA